MICDQWDVLVVPFPFTDRNDAKRRPAVVLTNRKSNIEGQTVMAMITSTTRQWLTDVSITDLASAGLPKECKVRLKLFTLDNRLILEIKGRLSEPDQRQVQSTWKQVGLFC